ncbi:restriction endonuclease subunit S [Bradyrhizobium sp. SZCCHNR2009]|uniref:restriction endonuclease subunit S n=1 Tax=Bradyrhizobium sp. SZCCHNR2009 TaxID=3057375 RepID=UPI0028E1E205|nr:restriction endonuclease subunit S [Bradyrhizobium sp. SZCCHNR2009]
MIASWPAKKLGELFTIERGGSPRPIEKYLTDDPSGLNWIKIGDATASGKFIEKTKEKILPEGLSKTRYVRPGDFLLTNSMSFGRPYIMATDGCIHDGWLVLRPNDPRSVDQDYFYHLLGSGSLYNLFSARAGGSTVKNLNTEIVSSVEVRLPPLDEQRRIAAILDKADALRRKRRRAIELLDSLTQSIFLDMFGDPVSNPKGWRARNLADFESFLTSGSRGWARYYSETGSAFIRIQNLQNGRLSLDDVQYVDAPANAEAKRTTVRDGDVLISITADLGRTAVVPVDLDGRAHINQHIALVRTVGINPTYLSMYLATSAGQAQFAALNRQGVKAGLNFDNIRGLRILEPPMPLQNEYEGRLKKIREISAKYHGEDRMQQLLFQSFQGRAFSGQL